MTHQVKVFNNNDFEIVDYFDGLAYRFEPRKAVNVPADAAKHIFGVEFPAEAEACANEDFRAVIFHFLQKRWGWNSAVPEKFAKAKELFANLTFVPVTFKLVENTAAKENDGIAEPRLPKSNAKGGRFKPRVEDEEEEVA